MSQLGSLLSLVSMGIIFASSSKNLVSSSEVAQIQTQYNTAHRQGQSSCSAPSSGCGYGLWNEESCRCDCIPDHCFDEIFQSCISSPGSCSNVFEGCTKYVDCPYFANPMVGKCDSSDTIAPGVYTIFRTAEDCCMANYPESLSCIPTAPPTVSPSSTAAIETIETKPSVIPPQADATFDLAPISIRFENLPSQFNLEKKKGDLQETFNSTLTQTSADFNATISSIDIFNDISSLFWDGNQMLLHITITGGNSPPGEIHFAFVNTLHNQIYQIADGLKEAWGPEIYTNSVILSIDSVATTLEPSLKPTSLSGISIPANADGDKGSESLPIWSVVLLVFFVAILFVGLLVWHHRRDKNSDVPTSSSNPYFEDEICDNSSRANINWSQEEINTKSVQYLPNWSNDVHQPRRASTGTNFNESGRSQMSFHPRPSSMGSYFDQSQHHIQPCQRNSVKILNELPHGHNISFQSRQSYASTTINQSEQNSGSTSQLDPDGTKNFHNSMDFTDSANKTDAERNSSNDDSSIDVDQNITGQKISSQHSTLKRDNQAEKREETDEFEESGYDGGGSSLFNVKEVSSNESSSQELDSDGSSSDDGNVLGLLYYDGASSAGESVARESRKSRRSGRTSRSRHSSGKSSSGKSSRTRPKSSKSTGSSKSKQRKKTKPLKKSSEETDHEKQHNSACEGLDGNPQQDSTYITKPIRGDVGDHISGSIVFGKSSESLKRRDTLDGNEFITANASDVQGGAESFYSHGSTIKTADCHHKRYQYATSDESFNSAGECITNLNNKPEVKL